MKTFESHNNGDGYNFWIAIGCYVLFFAGVYFYRHYEQILNLIQ